MKKRLSPLLIERIEDVVALGETPLPLYALEKDCHVLDAIRLLTTAPGRGDDDADGLCHDHRFAQHRPPVNPMFASVH